MIKVTKAEVVSVTPQIAKKLLEENRYPKQRGLNPERISKHVRDMCNGDFLPTMSIEFARLGDEDYLINGQHRLEAIIRSGMTIDFLRVDKLVDTEDELNKLYYETDMGLPRTIGQMFRSMEVGDRLGVPEYLAQRAGHAVNFIRNGWLPNKRGGLTKDEILRELLGNYRDPLVQYREASIARIGGIYNSMYRASVCSLGLETFRYMADDPQRFERTMEFWSGVVSGDGLRMGDPRLVARDHILTTTLGDEKGVERVTPAYQVRYLAACWNAWSEDKTFTPSRTGSIRITDPNAPIRILGTPWDGTKVK